MGTELVIAGIGIVVLTTVTSQFLKNQLDLEDWGARWLTLAVASAHAALAMAIRDSSELESFGLAEWLNFAGEWYGTSWIVALAAMGAYGLYNGAKDQLFPSPSRVFYESPQSEISSEVLSRHKRGR